uniref:Fibrinogen-like protein 1 isoform X2 n=1 Tax=Crassostrea virginica TaxID=6565 RepID=A0A8B8BGA2_CRAVI|nr:fibrinogen-like protein 1 isoform X2 [Crassostrea virginica]XP_022302031.1 fibrinogen-like protein 1 isoform X2 [Crassostrea virginica]
MIAMVLETVLCGPIEDNGTVTCHRTNLHERITKTKCAAKCLDDLLCNAIELCTTPSGLECRLSRGWKNTGGVLSGAICNRFQIVDKCEGEEYVDRRNGLCVYGDLCETCDCISTYTQKSGVYRIFIAGDPKHVYCSFEGNLVWTVLQRRKDGSENFYRNWSDYEFGFGSPSSEVWLGNKYIHQLTADGHTILRIELEDHSGNKRYAEYSSFTVADLNDNYRIHVSGYTGNAGDSFAGTCSICNNGMPFTTYDRDNDNFPNFQCAVWAKGGWWHNACQKSNLNGKYGDDGYGQGVNWEDWLTLSYSLKASTMKVRRQ